MKYEKEFRQAHPETIGETDSAFDMSNYIDWLDAEYEKLKSSDVMLLLLDQMATALTEISEHMAKSNYDKSLGIMLRCAEPLQSYKKFKSNSNEA